MVNSEKWSYLLFKVDPHDEVQRHVPTVHDLVIAVNHYRAFGVVSAQTFADQLTFQGLPLVVRNVREILGEPRLAQLIHHQNEIYHF